MPYSFRQRAESKSVCGAGPRPARGPPAPLARADSRVVACGSRPAGAPAAGEGARPTSARCSKAAKLYGIALQRAPRSEVEQAPTRVRLNRTRSRLALRERADHRQHERRIVVGLEHQQNPQDESAKPDDKAEKTHDQMQTPRQREGYDTQGDPENDPRDIEED